MSPKRPDHAVATDFTVGLHHCDLLGVAWHGRYFEWLEAARTALFASRDLDIPAIAGLGHRMYVVDARCRYMTPVGYGDTVRVTAWFTAVTPLIRVAYDVRRRCDGAGDGAGDGTGDGPRSARAHTVLATTDADGALLATTPAALLERLPEVDERVAGADDDSGG